MKNLALNRLNILCIPKGKGMDPKKKIVFLSELANMGYRISNPDLLEESSDAFFQDYKKMIKKLKEKKGGNVKYVPLFNGFPNKIPEDRSYFERRLIGFWGNAFNLFNLNDQSVKLANGVLIPKWLFDVYDFGADPISQNQSKELHALGLKNQAKRAKDNHTEWLTLDLVFEQDLEFKLSEYLLNLLYAKSSIKEALHDDLMALMDHLGTTAIDFKKIIRKETKAFVMAYFWKRQEFAQFAKVANTPTDVLRLFAALTETDVSLATTIKFPKLKRRERKVILGVLENSVSLKEDLVLYKSLWLEIGRYLHPTEYKKAFPLTANAFYLLRNAKIQTFNSKTEALLLNGSIEDLLAHLTKKPGVFLRKLHEVLRRFPKDNEKVLEAFEAYLPKVPLKNLLVLYSYFSHINDAKNRTVVNKKGKIIVLENNSQNQLSPKIVVQLLDALTFGILIQLEGKETWKDKKVYIYPELSEYTVPLQQRKASDGMITVGRGSQIDIDLDKVLRLFIYWKEANQRTDLDLSIMQFDAGFNYIGHVSYTNLKSDGIVHSGDITSAPYGAAEFIDITLSKISKNVKYLAVQINKYDGDGFAEMDCHAGWMIREEVDNDIKSFDIKTVQNKFDLNGIGGYCIPLIVNLDQQKVIFTDLFMSGKTFHNNVESAYGSVSIISRELAKFTLTRPNMYFLSVLNLEARNGQMVVEKEEADVSIGLKDCDINVTEVESILTELI